MEKNNYFREGEFDNIESEGRNKNQKQIGKTALLGLGFERFVDRNEVINGLFEASTLANPDARPYKGANINYEKIKFNEIRPTQFYRIEENIQKLAEIRKFVLEYGQDILNLLAGGVELVSGLQSEIILPPIVENDPQEGLVILDGTHRSFLAQRLGMAAMNFILIDGVNEEFALNKRRLANEWSEVQSFETVLDLKEARARGFIHRREGLGENQDNSYRDFSHLTNRGKDVRK